MENEKNCCEVFLEILEHLNYAVNYKRRLNTYLREENGKYIGYGIAYTTPPQKIGDNQTNHNLDLL